MLSNVRKCCQRVFGFCTDKDTKCIFLTLAQASWVQSQRFRGAAFPPVLPLWGNGGRGEAAVSGAQQLRVIRCSPGAQVGAEAAAFCDLLTYRYSHRVLSVNARRISTVHFLPIHNCLNWYSYKM